jgi:hypothetical protein
MKRHFWFVVVGVCLVVLSALGGGCIRVVVSPTDTTAPAGSKPVINSFTANPQYITQGASPTLSWSVTGASMVSIDQGIGNVALTSSTAVTPHATTIYTLTATNAAGSVMATAQIVVASETPSPPPVSPAVTNVTASADPPSFSGQCPKTFNFSAVITVTGPGTVTYAWERSDGTIAPAESINFTGPGAQTVSNSWQLGAAGPYWQRIHIFTPNEMMSNQVNVTLNCTAAGTWIWTGTWQITSGQNAFGSVMTLLQNEYQVTGSYAQHENGKINGTASNNMLTGTWSEEPTYSPPHDAGDFQLTMSPDGNSFTGNWRYGSSGDWAGSWNGTRVTP